MLRQVDVLVSQGDNIADAISQIGVSETALTLRSVRAPALLIAGLGVLYWLHQSLVRHYRTPAGGVAGKRD